MCLDYRYTNLQQYVVIQSRQASCISALYAILSCIFLGILYYAQYSSIDATKLESTKKKVDAMDIRLNTTIDNVNTIQDFLHGLNTTVAIAVNTGVSSAIQGPLNNLTTEVRQLSDNMDTLRKEYEKTSKFMDDVTTFMTQTKEQFEKHKSVIEGNRERITLVENRQNFYQELLYLHIQVYKATKRACDIIKYL